MESQVHVAGATTWDSGGGQEFDLLTIKDGRAPVIREL